MKIQKIHNTSTQSYSIKLTDSTFTTFHVGQYISLSIKMNDLWLERPYTISDLPTKNEARITIKLNSNSIFTRWLFYHAPKEINVLVNEPRGSFLLRLDNDSDILCFAGGIGITPFITFSKSFASVNRENKKMRILYAVQDDEDIVFSDEFESIVNQTPSLTIAYRSTNKEGALSDKEIYDLVRSLNHPDIYICGPEGFTKSIQNILHSIDYEKIKIKTDQYVHVSEQN